MQCKSTEGQRTTRSRYTKKARSRNVRTVIFFPTLVKYHCHGIFYLEGMASFESGSPDLTIISFSAIFCQRIRTRNVKRNEIDRKSFEFHILQIEEETISSGD